MTPAETAAEIAEVVDAAEDLANWFAEAIKMHGTSAPSTVGDGERIALLIGDLARLVAHLTPEHEVREGIHRILTADRCECGDLSGIHGKWIYGHGTQWRDGTGRCNGTRDNGDPCDCYAFRQIPTPELPE